jgi:O-antigen ligase
MASLPSAMVVGFALTGALWLFLLGTWYQRNDAVRGEQSMLLPGLLAVACIVPTAAGVIADANARVVTPNLEGTLNHVLLAVFVYITFLGLMARLLSKKGFHFKNPFLSIPLLLYWLSGTIAGTISNNTSTRVSAFAIPLIIISIDTIFPTYRVSIRTLRNGSLWLCYGSVILTIVEPSHAFYLATRIFHWEPDRLAGLTDHPNTLGLIAVLAFLLTLSDASRWRVLHLGIAGGVLVASESRDAWIAGIAGVALIVGRRLGGGSALRGSLTPALLLGAPVAAIAVLWLAATSAVREVDITSFNGRLPLWQDSVAVWKTAPVLGLGDGVWKALIQSGRVPSYGGEAHNQLLETLVTHGIVGLLLLIVIVVAWSAGVRRAARSGYWEPALIMVVLVVYSVFASPLAFGGTDIQFLITTVGVLAVPRERAREEVAVEEVRTSHTLYPSFGRRT